MSTNGADQSQRAVRFASAVFVALLLLALVWPVPVLWLNEATFDAPLSIDRDSFLGREAPSWDVAFWAIAGLYVLAVLHGRVGRVTTSLRLFGADMRRIRDTVVEHHRELPIATVLVTLVLSAIAVALTWWFLDAPIVAFVESIQSETTMLVARFLNRFGGGMNPVMIVLFFLLVGLAYSRTLWIELAVCMVLAGGGAGLLVQIVKKLVGRSRPELWLGPFHHAWPSATSFPSGHTVGAFALASVLFFGSRSRFLGWFAMVLAAGVGLSRVLSFRHWPSDVLASAILGTAVGWFFVEPLVMARSAEKAGGGSGARGDGDLAGVTINESTDRRIAELRDLS